MTLTRDPKSPLEEAFTGTRKSRLYGIPTEMPGKKRGADGCIEGVQGRQLPWPGHELHDPKGFRV